MVYLKPKYFKGKVVGHINGFNERLPINLISEIQPFYSEKSGKFGLPTELAAQILIWSTHKYGVVVKDKKGLFHAISTQHSRIPLEESHPDKEESRSSNAPKFPLRIQPSRVNKFREFEVVRHVRVPALLLESVKPIFLIQKPTTFKVVKPCHVEFHPGVKPRPQSLFFKDLEDKCINAVKNWKAWVNTLSEIERLGLTPRQPHKTIVEPFIGILSTLLDIKKDDVYVSKFSEDNPADVLTFNPFFTERRGFTNESGPSFSDWIFNSKRETRVKSHIVISPPAFSTHFPLVGVLGTIAHEGAHYLHQMMTSVLLSKWAESSKGANIRTTKLNRNRKKEVVLQTIRNFLKRLLKKKHLSIDEYYLVLESYTGTNIKTATHPLAELHGFIATYPLCPREVDVGVWGIKTARFSKLDGINGKEKGGAHKWNDVIHPTIHSLFLEELSSFLKKHGGRCALEDLRSATQATLDREARNGNTLRLMFVDKIEKILTEGRSQVIVAKISNVLHIRIFNDNGEMTVDKKQSEFNDDNELQKLQLLMSKASHISPSHSDKMKIFDTSILIADQPKLKYNPAKESASKVWEDIKNIMGKELDKYSR